MSMLAMTDEEEKRIDSRVEQMMDWAKARQAEAEQLAYDATRLLACSTDRLEKLKNQGFFQRCWNRLTGKAGEMERANVNDVIHMQKIAFRYVNMLQEQQLLMAHSLLSLKNNLNSLALREEETRELVGKLAQRTLERFEQLEGRVEQLEISSNLHGWLLGLEEREYDVKYPTEYMRLFRVINDFYQLKNDNWNYNDLLLLRKGIRTVGLDPRKTISLDNLIDNLTDEIQSANVGFEKYSLSISICCPNGLTNYSKFIIDNISSPILVAIHGLKIIYIDRLDVVQVLKDTSTITATDMLKALLKDSISKMNVNNKYELSLSDIAIDILGGLRLSNHLFNVYSLNSICNKNNNTTNENNYDKVLDTIMSKI